MKFFRTASPGLVAMAVLLCVVPAFASEAPDSPDSNASGSGEVLTDAPDIPAPAGDGSDVDDASTDENGGGSAPVLSAPGTVTCSGAEVTVNLDDRSYASVVDVEAPDASAYEDTPGGASDDSGTLPGFLRAMFGEYTPKTQTVTTYFDGQPLDVSTEYVPGIAGVDMEWIASVLLFGIVVYCLFRLLGGIVR